MKNWSLISKNILTINANKIFFFFQSNILVPYGLTGPTKMLKLVINIYSAKILEEKEISLVDKVKNLFGYKQIDNSISQVEQVSLLLSDDESKTKLNPFIRVSFGGLTVI